MRQTLLLISGLVGVAIVARLLVIVVAPKVRAQQSPDSLVGKHLTLGPVIKGLKEPTFVAWPPDGSRRAFVLERGGLVRTVGADGQLRPTPFLDLSQQVSLGNEEGLLGLAFDPAFAENGYLYAATRRSTGRYRWFATPPRRITQMWSIPQRHRSF